MTNKNKDKRKIFLFGEINNETVQGIIKSLLEFNNNKKDVYLYISSPGGETEPGIALLDVMNLVQYDINTIAIGECCSMASIIVACGSKGKRWISKNSRLMFHKGSVEIGGNEDELTQTLKMFKMNENILNKIFADKVGKSVKSIKKDFSIKDFWLTSEKAIKYGAVDDIWDQNKELESNN